MNDARKTIQQYSKIKDEALLAKVADTLDLLLAGNQRFVTGAPATRDMGTERASLVNEQHPIVTILGCSDSRVNDPDIYDMPLGKIFSIKTAGEALDYVAIASVEYGIGHLETPLLLVEGHDGCGAVKAAFSGGEAHGALGRLINQVEKNIRGVPTFDEAVVANTRKTMQNLLRKSAEVRGAYAHGELAIVPVQYHLQDGTVKILAKK